jgi:hypothetical protein
VLKKPFVLSLAKHGQFFSISTTVSRFMGTSKNPDFVIPTNAEIQLNLKKTIDGMVGANLFVPTNAIQHHEAMRDSPPTAFLESTYEIAVEVLVCSNQ